MNPEASPKADGLAVFDSDEQYDMNIYLSNISEQRAFEKNGYNVGVAFQIRDDLLDVIGDTETLGKNVGSDEKDGKQTYVTLHGIEQSEADEKKLTEEALSLLEGLPGNHEFMEELILSLLGRRK